MSNNLSDKEQRTITNLVKKYVPEARLEHCIEQDLSMVLPYDSVVRFKQLLHSLDQRLVELKSVVAEILVASVEVNPAMPPWTVAKAKDMGEKICDNGQKRRKFHRCIGCV